MQCLGLPEKERSVQAAGFDCIRHKLTPTGQTRVTLASKVCHSIVSVLKSSR